MARNNLGQATGEAGDAAAARHVLAELVPVMERVLGPGTRRHLTFVST